MLELKNIKKYYQTSSFKQMALNGVSLTLNQGEIVSILGPSGSGKTTLLNIIGGLDRYTSGDLIINGKSTKAFRDSDWDSYRNNSIGFVFQSYNLINHISVLDNVEMALTLSGVNAKEKRDKATEVLQKVGLIDHIYKKPTQLSGGQKQRVAIARALANNPDIILMDEPTGALDTKTSVQILDLVKEIASDKLVIIVTHNPLLAEKYSTRIVKLQDGEIIDDTKPSSSSTPKGTYNAKKTSMSFMTALKLSFNNLRTKLVRSLITAFAASIGIIGVALVLSISNGFGSEVNRLQRESLSGMPISINQYSMNISRESFMNHAKEQQKPEADFIYPYERSRAYIDTHLNKIDTNYLNYLEAMDPSLYESISYTYQTSMFNLLFKNASDVVLPLRARDINFAVLPNNYDYLLTQFKLLAGRMPENAYEVILVTDNYQRIDQEILAAIGVDIEEEVAYDQILGAKFVSAKNNDYYTKVDSTYKPNIDLSTAYDNGFPLEIVGIIRGETEVASMLLSEGIAYDSRLTDVFFNESLNSDIVKFQEESDNDVLTGLPFNPLIGSTKEATLKTIGGIEIPSTIQIYTSDFDTKQALKEYLDKYNESLPEEDKILYTDLAQEFTNIMSSLVSGISIVLIAFAGISLVVSSIMIGIITYVSVLERTKEIGVLRSLGARKKDISRVFNAETFIIGLTAGTVGILITVILNIPLDAILTKAAPGMTNIASLSVTHAILLVVISIILTLISGLIPARIAAKKDPVNALRVES